MLVVGKSLSSGHGHLEVMVEQIMGDILSLYFYS